MENRDFFISYTAKDEKWATWIAGVLEKNNYRTCIQAWDFQPGGDFVLDMHNALIHCDRFIAVLSAEYMKSFYCQAEWTAAFTKNANKDPNSGKALLIPIRIDDYEPEGLLASIKYIDLFDVDEKEAEERLKQLTDESISRNKPDYPGKPSPAIPS